MLILASASPARRALLRQAGVRFKAVPAGVRELRGRGRTLRATVIENARRKCAAVPGDRVLAADTMISHRRRMYGKPSSRRDAVALLVRLAGRTHVIGTGIVFRDGNRQVERYVETRVTLRALDRAGIERLLRRYDPTRFAGGYAIRRDDPLVERVDGSFTNVVGLPMEVVIPLIERGPLPGGGRGPVDRTKPR